MRGEKTAVAEAIKADILTDAELCFEPIPAFTEDDFKYTTKPLLWIVSHASEGEYMLGRYADFVIEAARKKYKICNYRTQYNAFFKAWRQKTGVRIDNVTSFDEQPLELYCGTFEASEEGVWCRNTYGDLTCACPHPIMPVRRLIDIDTGEVRIEIAFRRGKAWRSVVMDKSSLASAAKIVALATYGVGVDSENARFLVKYFTEV